MIAAKAFRLALLAAGTAGGLSGAAYGLLTGQSHYARRVIGTPTVEPLRADGIHLPDGTGPVPRAELPADAEPLEFAMLGDSSAAGLGVEAFEREDKRIDFESWLERAGTPPEDGARSRELLADRIEDGKLRLDRGIFKGRKR